MPCHHQGTDYVVLSPTLKLDIIITTAPNVFLQDITTTLAIPHHTTVIITEVSKQGFEISITLYNMCYWSFDHEGTMNYVYHLIWPLLLPLFAHHLLKLQPWRNYELHYHLIWPLLFLFTHHHWSFNHEGTMNYTTTWSDHLCRIFNTLFTHHYWSFSHEGTMERRQLHWYHLTWPSKLPNILPSSLGECSAITKREGTMYRHQTMSGLPLIRPPLRPIKVSWQGWTHFRGELVLNLYTFEVAWIQGWPHFRGPY